MNPYFAFASRVAVKPVINAMRHRWISSKSDCVNVLESWDHSRLKQPGTHAPSPPVGLSWRVVATIRRFFCDDCLAVCSASRLSIKSVDFFPQTPYSVWVGARFAHDKSM